MNSCGGNPGSTLLNGTRRMHTRIMTLTLGLSLLAISSANAQVISGNMTVTGVEMH